MSEVKAITILINKEGVFTGFFKNKFAKYESSIKDDLGNEVWTTVYHLDNIYKEHLELFRSYLKELKEFEDIE